MAESSGLYSKKLGVGFSVSIGFILISVGLFIFVQSSERAHKKQEIYIEFMPEIMEENDYPVYRLDSKKEELGVIEAKLKIESHGNSRFGKNYNLLTLKVVYVDKDAVRILIRDSDEKNWVLDEFDYGSRYINNNYEVKVQEYPFCFEITNKKTKGVVFSTIGKNFYFSERYIELQSSFDPDKLKVGLSRENDGFYLSVKNYSIWTSKEHPGSHPVILMLGEKSASGLFLHNNNAMQIEFNHNTLTYRLTGGIIDLYVILGNTGEKVTENLHKIIGLPSLPPYSSIGYHLGTHLSSVSALSKSLEFLQANSIPVDYLWLGGALNNLSFRDELIGLKGFLDGFRDSNVTVGIEIPSDVPSDYNSFSSVQSSLLEIKTENYSNYIDWFHKDSDRSWWLILDSMLRHLEISAFQLVNNEVYTTQTSENLSIPFVPNELCLECGSLPLSTVHNNSFTELDLHSLWGDMQAKSTLKYLSGKRKRPFVLSQSTRTGSKSGHVINQDPINWTSFRYSIWATLTYDFSGIRAGPNICGQSAGKAEPDLCLKWHNIGAFMPIFYNSKNDPIEEVSFFNTEFLPKIQASIRMRYSLSLYIYSLFFESALHGGSVCRSPLFEHPDLKLKDMSSQIMLGAALLGVFSTDKEPETKFYLPEGKWYNLRNGQEKNSKELLSEYIENDFLVFIKGGFVVPYQDPEAVLNIKEMRNKSITLIIALTEQYESNGFFFVDDGESLNTLSDKKFTKVTISAKIGEGLEISVKSIVKGYVKEFRKISAVKVYGCPWPIAVMVGGERVNHSYQSGVLSIEMDFETFIDTQISIILK